MFKTTLGATLALKFSLGSYVCEAMSSFIKNLKHAVKVHHPVWNLSMKMLLPLKLHKPKKMLVLSSISKMRGSHVYTVTEAMSTQGQTDESSFALTVL